LGTLALIQYNKLSVCLFLNRPANLFRHIQLSWQTWCRDVISLVVVKGVHRTAAYVESNDLVEFKAQKSTKGIDDPFVLLARFFEA
jgi:hypothetical protein